MIKERGKVRVSRFEEIAGGIRRRQMREDIVYHGTRDMADARGRPYLLAGKSQPESQDLE